MSSSNTGARNTTRATSTPNPAAFFVVTAPSPRKACETHHRHLYEAMRAVADMRQLYGNFVDGRRIRWRARPCNACGGWRTRKEVKREPT